MLDSQIPMTMSEMAPSFDYGKLRPGQRGAIIEIVTRRRNGESFTAVVLPTRYGKSDVARLSALQMIDTGMVSNALIIVPARNLVEQMVDNTKLKASAQRYGLQATRFAPTQSIDRRPRLERLRTAKLSAITTSMANRHLITLRRWVGIMLDRQRGHGLPPVVYMDEAHLGSDSNRWGNIVSSMAEAGAYVVVMTATPHRSDGRPIPGFEVYREVVGTTSTGGERVHYEIDPHWETTLAEAMEEDPPPLAGITYQPFGIKGYLTDDFAGTVKEGVNLDELDERVIRRAYRQVLRESKIVEGALRYFLVELKNRRNKSRQSGTTGIIFVGNHEEEFDKSENEHARTVKQLVGELSSTLRCEIIVSSDPQAQELLDEFIAGDVDVAIVKQMGAIGLDVDHLKVALDLSNTRSRAYFLQRMMRIATRWDDPDFPDDPVTTCTYIAPDDWITREAVNQALEGTEMLRVVEESPPLPQGKIEVPSIPLSAPVFTAEGLVLSGNLKDYDGVLAPASGLPLTDSFNSAFPEMAGRLPKARLTNWVIDAVKAEVSRLGNSEVAVDGGSITGAPDEAPEGLDMTKELNQWRKKVSDSGKKAINARFKRQFGDYGANRDKYQRVATRFWSDHFARVGLSRSGTKLEDIDYVDKLKAIYKNIQKELGR